MPTPIPNLLFVTIDCLRTDALGCYGGPATAPNIDNLAAHGIRYQNAFAHGHFTKPAFAAIFSGSLPWEYGGSDHFANSRPNFVEKLHDHGYQTLGVNSNPWLSQAFGYHRGYTVYRDLSTDKPQAHSLQVRAINNFLGIFGGGLIYPTYPSAEDVTDAAIDLLAQARAPFFLWLHYMDAHWPYNLSKSRLYGPWDQRHWAYNARLANRSRKYPAKVTSREHAALYSMYTDGITRIDKELSRLLKHISPVPTIILTSDHGEAFGEHGRHFHYTSLYSENLRVPLIIRGPDLPTNQIETQVVRHIDLAPTILDLAHTPYEHEFTGISLLPSMHAQTLLPDLDAIGAIGYPYKDDCWISIRRQGWAAITHYQQDSMKIYDSSLYCLLKDPLETQNLADLHPHQLDTLQSRSLRYFSETDLSDDAGSSPPSELDKGLAEHLKALGYLE